MNSLNVRVLVLVSLTVLLTIAATALTGKRQTVTAQNPLGNAPEERFVPGRILVKFNDGVLPEHARNIIAALGARDADEIPGIGVHILDLPSQADEKAFVNAFGARAEVQFAELDEIRAPADVTPNDPWYPNEWHLTKISAPTAWSSTTGSSDVTIAILDTGVDSTHPDLAANMVSGWNFYDNNSNTSDVVGHGTAVAGTVSASSNNGQGVASIAWSSHLMPIRISDPNGNATYSAAANGLTWAANHGARVANISYIMTDSSTVTSAAQYFQSKGGVVTVSAGNNSTFDSSSDNPYVLTVSGITGSDVIWSYSNTGNNVDLCAPYYAYTTIKGGGYSGMTGTSFSAPIVAGVAALVISVNPNLTASQIQDILQQSADDLGAASWDSTYGWGRVNAARAVVMAGGVPAPSPTPTPTSSPTPSPSPTPTPSDGITPSATIISPTDGSSVSMNQSINVSATDNIAVTKVELYVDGILTSTSTSAPFTTKWNTRKASRGVHALQCKAYDTAGNVGTSQVVSVYK